MRQIFLDTETTGLSAENGDRVIEIGCVEFIDRKPSGRNHHRFFNPDRDSHEEALRIHGISNESLKDKPRFAQETDALLAFLKGADEIIIHNAPFDEGFLNKELELAGLPSLKSCLPGTKITDSLMMAKEIYPGKRNSLDALCLRLEVDNTGRTLHGALLDAELLAEVYINLTRGQNSLAMDIQDFDAISQASDGSRLGLIDLSAFALPVLQADGAELARHETVLLEIDKSSKSSTVWRLISNH